MGYDTLVTGRDVGMFEDNSLEVAFTYPRGVSMRAHRPVLYTQRRAE